MPSLTSLLLASTVTLASAVPAMAEVAVVASIKPLHSLIAGVMDGVGTPDLIVDGAASPHVHALKPSKAQQLQDADVVFWIGHELEAFLEKPLETLPRENAVIVELLESDGLVRHSIRQDEAFEAHSHAHADEDKHADEDGHDHDHGDDHDHDHDGHDHDEHDHDEHAGGEPALDPHVWLDPENAKVFVAAIAATLAKADPDNAPAYAANAETMTGRLDALQAELAKELAPAAGKPFVVFHDAYQYFEKRFGLTAAGAITLSPETAPGAERVAEISGKIRSLDAVCIFSEPQFEPKLVTVVAEGSNARSGVLDPLGASLDNGPELYPTLLRNMAGAVSGCLLGGS
ncbi:zinc ABC transporter substrate-binding protein ZnuA [Stappia taiwanensis]|uniref:High-affinity zinc uptake system protein ZnuA n=1 Tax=Stappia taiwanensis TaxID=992267 RepID=A0A838XS96_9HYPH|nr:zinc ABC transporter substrate-binding protein ZnuA [Stappia taiwanensis]MBA4611406.1 zinc ABC transporter substrate-binding protein ZnuA [Stappia taiwanensis]